MNFQEQVSLADYTTLRAGGSARYLFSVVSEKDLIEALSFAEERALPIHILGGGSNTLFSGGGFQGVVMHMKNRGIAFFDSDADTVLCVAEAGEVWDDVVKSAVERGFSGIECLAGIPGTVGGAVVQNIGAYGSDIKESVMWVEAYDCKRKDMIRIEHSACCFGYRDSFFKKEAGRYVVLRVALKLSQGRQDQMLHKEIETELRKVAHEIRTPEMIAEAVARVRARKLPDWRVIGTAGSFFKNPVVDEKAGSRVLEKYSDAVHTTLSDGSIKFAAGWLIDHVAGMRGVREGNVGTWENQALVIVNEGRENSGEIHAFAEKVQTVVYEKTGIHLEPEVVIVK